MCVCVCIPVDPITYKISGSIFNPEVSKHSHVDPVSCYKTPGLVGYCYKPH